MNTTPTKQPLARMAGIAILFSGLLLLTLACELPALGSTPIETDIAIALEFTRLAEKEIALAARQTELSKTMAVANAVTSTSTPLPSQTPEPTNTEVPTNLPSPTARFFAIQDKAFQDYEKSCQTDVDIIGVDGSSLQIRVNSTISMIDGNWAVFCYGAKHTWIGVLTYEGYTFASDENDPLQFQVTENQGYVYIKGTGAVTMPDGTQVRLPDE